VNFYCGAGEAAAAGRLGGGFFAGGFRGWSVAMSGAGVNTGAAGVV
jgi:hypothetical protein